MVAQQITNLAISMFSARSYPFKMVAFVKVKYPDGNKMLSIVVDKNRDLMDFCNWITKPIHQKPNHAITAHNLLFISFHKKTKGDKTFNMENNPEYIISWTPNRGFFSKSTATLFRKL